MAPVFEKFSSVVITSGTISPLDMCESGPALDERSLNSPRSLFRLSSDPKMLQFTPVVIESYPMTLNRSSFLPLVGALPVFA